MNLVTFFFLLDKNFKRRSSNFFGDLSVHFIIPRGALRKHRTLQGTIYSNAQLAEAKTIQALKLRQQHEHINLRREWSDIGRYHPTLLSLPYHFFITPLNVILNFAGLKFNSYTQRMAPIWLKIACCRFVIFFMRISQPFMASHTISQ